MSSRKKLKYNGPSTRIIIGTTSYDPKSFTEKQKADFIKKYPTRASWWSKAKPKTTKSTKTTKAADSDTSISSPNN